MSPWDILQIEATQDIKTIKRAYSKQLKIHHPEDDPEGYQQLREAYDYIMATVQEQTKQTILLDKTILAPPLLPESQEEEVRAIDEKFNAPPKLSILSDTHQIADNPETSISLFVEQLISLYQDFPSRITMELWIQLFDSNICWDLQKRSYLNSKMIETLNIYRYLPQQVWFMIEELFHLKAFIEEQELIQEGSENLSQFYSFYVAQIYEPALSYDGLLALDSEQAGQFVELREQGYRKLQENQLTEAMHFLSQAYLLYPHDKDVVRLFIESQFRNDNIEYALTLSEELIDLAPKEIDGYRYKAKLLYLQHKYTEAAGAYHYIKIYWPHYTEATRMLAECLIHNGEQLQAKKQLASLVNSMPDELEDHSLQIYNRLFHLGLIKIDEPKQPESENIYGLDDVPIPSGGIPFPMILIIVLLSLVVIGKLLLT